MNKMKSSPINERWYYVDCHIEVKGAHKDDVRDKLKKKYPGLHIDLIEEL